MTNKYKQSFVSSMLGDGTDDCISSKRVITMLSFILCSMAFLGDLFWDLTVRADLFEGMIYLTIAGLGFTASEKFANLGRKRYSRHDEIEIIDDEYDRPNNYDDYSSERNVRKNVSRRSRYE